MIGKLLIIEDDRDLAQIIRINMQDLGFEVEAVHDGMRGLEKARTGEFNFIILDIQLPGLIGFDICQRLRAEGVNTPILMLTSRSDELDKIVGLETGADDYLTKPFSIRELQARVRAIQRRAETRINPSTNAQSKAISIGGLEIDPEKARVTLNGHEISLTAKEFQLLEHFARHPGRVFNRDQLLESIWGYGYEGYEHTVNTTINRLRNKIEEDLSNPRFILTVRGLGYKFADFEDRG